MDIRTLALALLLTSVGCASSAKAPVVEQNARPPVKHHATKTPEPATLASEVEDYLDRVRPEDLFHPTYPVFSLRHATRFLALAQGPEDEEDLKGPPGTPQLDADEIARQLSNPATPLASLGNKLDYVRFRGDLPGADSQDFFKYTFQPVFPFPQGPGRSIIVRPGIPFIFDQPVLGPSGFGSQSGLGDISLDLLYAITLKSGVVLGFGLVQVFPTATDNGLGPDEWQIGPDLLVAVVRKWGVVGALFQHFVGITGDTDVNLSSLQLFYFFGVGNGWQVGGSPTITANWDANSDNRWTVPIALAVTKTVSAGKTPVKLAFEVFYTLESPDSFGQKWGFRLTITPVIPNPFAKKKS